MVNLLTNFRQSAVRDALMSKEMWIDSLRNARGCSVLFDELPEASGGVGSVPIRFKQIGRPLRVLALHVLGQLAPKIQRKKDIPILVALALSDPDLTGLEINLGEAESDEFCVADTSEQQQFKHRPISNSRL